MRDQVVAAQLALCKRHRLAFARIVQHATNHHCDDMLMQGPTGGARVPTPDPPLLASLHTG